MKICKMKGVTLIELLVVITIITGLLTITGGAATSTIDRARAQTEYISFKGLIRAASIRAFTNGVGLSIKFDSNHLTVIVDEQVLSQKSYEYLYFEEQILDFSRNGFPSDQFISLQVRGKEMTTDLNLEIRLKGKQE